MAKGRVGFAVECLALTTMPLATTLAFDEIVVSLNVLKWGWAKRCKLFVCYVLLPILLHMDTSILKTWVLLVSPGLLSTGGAVKSLHRHILPLSDRCTHTDADI